MARKYRLYTPERSPCEAKAFIEGLRIDFTREYRDLMLHERKVIADQARANKYRKPRGARYSHEQMYYQLLQSKSCPRK